MTLLEEDGTPAVFDRYSNSFIKIYFPIPAGREDEIARKVLIKHLQSGNSYGIALKERHCKFPQPAAGPVGRGLADGRHRLDAAGARGLGAAGATERRDRGRDGRRRPHAKLVAPRGGAGRGRERRSAGARRADVCIVGGGFTGLWTALRIKELRALPRT